MQWIYSGDFFLPAVVSGAAVSFFIDKILLVSPLLLVLLLVLAPLIYPFITSKSTWRRLLRTNKQIFTFYIVIIIFILVDIFALSIRDIIGNSSPVNYGIAKEIALGILNGLLLGFLALFTIDAARKRYEQFKSEENLENTVKQIEKLRKNGFDQEALRISTDLFKDTYQLLEQGKTSGKTSPIVSAYIGNLEVFGNSLLESSRFIDELKNLKRVERIYNEIFEITVKHGVSRTKKEDTPSKMRKMHLKHALINKDKRESMQNLIRYARFLNTWTDVCIRLSSYIDKHRYLVQAERNLMWTQSLFEICDRVPEHPVLDSILQKVELKTCAEASEHPVNRCLDFILQRLRYFRLDGQWTHESNRVKQVKQGENHKKDYEMNMENAEDKFRKALEYFSNLFDNDKNFYGYLDIGSNPTVTDKKLESLIRENVLAKINKSDNGNFFLWESIERYQLNKTEFDDMLKCYRESPFNDDDGPSTIEESLVDEFIIEIAKVCQNIALNRIRYIKHANDFLKNELPVCHYKTSNEIIKWALSRMRSLIAFELSWKDCISYYDNMGIYLTEKGLYESKILGDHEQAKSNFEAAILNHKLAFTHITDPGLHQLMNFSDDDDMSIKTKTDYNKINHLVYLRNLIDLGRAYQCFYECSYGIKKKNFLFSQAEDKLATALELATRTDNFIYRARAHGFLGELYTCEKAHWGDALIAFRCCKEVFTKNEYPVYHNRTCKRLAEFFFEKQEKIELLTKRFFGEGLNLCANYYNKCACEILKNENSPASYEKMFDRAPDECPCSNMPCKKDW